MADGTMGVPVSIVKALEFSKHYAIQGHIVSRSIEHEYPRNRSDVYEANNIDIHVSNEEAMDDISARLTFIYTPTTSAGVSYTNAAIAKNYVGAGWDFFDRIEHKYGGEVMDTHEFANRVNNIATYHNFSEAWFKYTNSITTKVLPPHLLNASIISKPTSETAASGAGAEYQIRYSLDLWKIIGGFRSGKIRPLMGNEVSIHLHTEAANKVMNDKTAADDKYKLTNIQLIYDKVYLSDTKKKEFELKMKSTDKRNALHIPYTSYSCVAVPCAASTTNYVFTTHDNNNLISAFIAYSPDGDKKTSYEAKDTNHYALHAFPMSNFTKYRIKVGGTNYTPVDGITTFTESFENTMNCIADRHNQLCSHIINDAVLKEAYAPAAVPPTYGMNLMSANLERTIEPDYDSLNVGIDCDGGRSRIDLELTTGAALSAASNFYFILFHKRELVISKGIAEVTH